MTHVLGSPFDLQNNNNDDDDDDNNNNKLIVIIKIYNNFSFFISVSLLINSLLNMYTFTNLLAYNMVMLLRSDDLLICMFNLTDLYKIPHLPSS